MLSRFPKLTETFILFEILELQRQGVDVRVHALVRERARAVHPAAAQLLPSVSFPDRAMAVLRSQLNWIRRRPGTYVGLWLAALVGNLGSPRFLVRALATVPLGTYLATRMGDVGVQHVHAHWATHSALAGMVAARLLRLPFSFTAHAHDIYVDRSMLRQKIGAASFVATISEYNRRLLQSLYPSETRGKVRVVHCGVDLAELSPPVRDASPGAPMRILCVASLQAQKGHADLLHAVANLRSRGVVAHLAIAGDGPEGVHLKQLAAALGLGESATFLGALPRPRILEELRRADVMALASTPLRNGKMEGIPVALMEGMAMELPVVATSISGIPELVDDGVTGYLVPPGDPEFLAAALARLEADRAGLRAMGSAGRRKVVQEFDLRASAAMLRDAFTASARAASAQSSGNYSAEPKR